MTEEEDEILTELMKYNKVWYNGDVYEYFDYEKGEYVKIPNSEKGTLKDD